MTTPANTTGQRIVLDYTSRDYKSIRSMLVGLAKGIMPDWQTVGENGDFGTLLLELYAYASDVMNYYVDRVASEAFLGTAVRRQSAMYIADMLGYRPGGQRAATVPLTVTWTWDTVNGPINPSTYSVTTPSTAENGVATVSLVNEGNGVDIVVGQTITVSGVDETLSPETPVFNGTFVVTSVIPSTPSEPFKMTYEVADTGSFTAAPDGASLVETGSVLILPARTRVSTSSDANGVSYTFETDYAVTLDSAAGKQDPNNENVYSVTAQVSATEGTSLAPYRIGTSQGIPNAEFVISEQGVVDRTIAIYTKENGQVVPWSRVDKMALATPTQSVYTVFIDDEDYTHILFGDNASGRIPPANVDIYASYRYGQGSAANSIGINTITNLENEAATSLGVTISNTASPSGGADVESVESMRYSVPRSEALKQRAVTLADYISLALQVPGITKATAYGSNYTTVYVRIASGSQSTGWLTSIITGCYVNNNVATVTLSNNAALNVGQVMYLSNVDEADLNGSAQVVQVFYSTNAVTISAGSDVSDTATVTTATTHGFKVGQPVTISGCSVSSYNGTHVVTAVTPDTFTFFKTGITGSPTDGTVVGAPGFTFSTAAITPPIADYDEWVADTGIPSASATTTDPAMQSLINALEAYLEDKKLIGSVVYGEPVEWTDTDLAVSVRALPLYNRESVRAAVQSAIENVFSYNNVDFGRRISIGDVYRAALSVDGVDYVTITKMETQGSGDGIVDINSIDDDPNNAYRIPRISSTISATWVTATGGLANT